MVDKISPLHRSWLMGKVRSKNTKPELIARSLLQQLGYRFTVNGPKNKKLPGKPDIVLPRYRTVVFVHGCFWHRCRKCKRATTPKTNLDYWLPKFERNVQRDRQNAQDLERLGWQVITLWECQLENVDKTTSKIINLLPRKHSLRYPEAIEDAALVAETKSQYARQPLRRNNQE
ncbi:MAG: very short patch repair endonuclease [Verrucomicrobiota bacterium]